MGSLALLIISLSISLLLSFATTSSASTDLQSHSGVSAEVTESMIRYNMEHLEELLTVEVSPDKTPELYSVQFTWPELEPDLKVSINLGKVTQQAEAASQTMKILVAHHQNLDCEFRLLDMSDRVLRRFSKIIEIPEDYVVSEKNSDLGDLSELVVSRLFLNSQIPLITGGRDIEIDANEIVADNGSIETFRSGTQASSDTASMKARSGGKLTIRTERISGILNVVLRGERGKNGAPGASWSGPRAKDGNPPGAGQCAITFTGGIAGCFSGTAGTSGAAGEKGSPGGPAGDGGDSGDLDLLIGNSSLFNPKIIFEPGNAGLPGPGGSGQPGGIAPGNGGFMPGPRGSDGAQGPAGDAGPAGKPGINGKACQTYDDTQIQSCI